MRTMPRLPHARAAFTRGGRLAGISVGLVGVASAFVGIAQYAEQHPSVHLTGEWRLNHTIESTSMAAYRGVRLGYRLFVSQKGDEITAEGEKCWENGRIMAPMERTPIEFAGTLDHGIVKGTFIEEGKRRRTTGYFSWSLRKDGSLTGTFRSTAANSRGSVMAQRVTEK